MAQNNHINELKDKINIVDIISSYVPLKKRGKNYLGLCPFHSEKTASFTVSQEKGLFHCFGCGAGGDAIAFLMKIENTDFWGALNFISEKTGLEIETPEKNSTAKSHLEIFFQATEAACKFFEQNLAAAGNYLSKRGINNPQFFRLGFAKDSWDDLFRFLTQKGFKERELEEAGLIVARQDKSGYYDRFRNRLIFPITDYRNRVIGFSGRAISNEPPKYLNSPDSPIFNKGSHLYNLGLAKDAIKHEKAVFIVEGNIDAIASYEAGIKNVVAPLGTAFTQNQANLLKRFCGLAVVAFDSDEAGIAACEKAYEALKSADIRVRIAAIKNAKDPDELIKKFGKDALVKMIKDSLPALEFKIKMIISRHNMSDPESKAMAAHKITSLLMQEKDKVVRDEYLKLASNLLGISQETLLMDLKYQNTANSRANLKKSTGRPNFKAKEAEKMLIKLAAESDEALLKIKNELSPEYFTYFKNIALQLWDKPASEALQSLDENDSKAYREIMLSEAPVSGNENILTDCINSLKTEEIKNKMEKIKQDISNSEKSSDFERLKLLNKEYLGLNEILRSMSR